MAWALAAAVGPVFGSFVVAILEDRQLMSGVGARLLKGLAWPVEIRRQRRALSGLYKRIAVMHPRSRSAVSAGRGVDKLYRGGHPRPPQWGCARTRCREFSHIPTAQ